MVQMRLLSWIVILELQQLDYEKVLMDVILNGGMEHVLVDIMFQLMMNGILYYLIGLVIMGFPFETDELSHESGFLVLLMI